MPILYISAVATWVTESHRFDITGVISVILAVLLYLVLFCMRARNNENYFVSSFTEALKNGRRI
jgi:hypothetical protein